jgi:ATP-dependent helicase/nuclease subunit B
MYNDVLDRMENAINYSYTKRQLSRRSAKRLYGPELITGASKLERYAECPFAYFMRYNLKARERRLYTVDQLDTGNLFHKILELFSRKLSVAHESWRDLTQERINELTDICVNEVSPDIPAFFSTARFTYLLKRVRRISKRSIWALSEHIKHGKFEPFGSEIAFTANSPITGIKIDLGGGRSIILTGQIDRVDIFDSSGKRYVKIIDYKSGNKKFDLEDVFFGTQLQLLLYMDAIIKNGKELFGDKCTMEILPGGLFYFNIDDPIIDEQETEKSFEEKLLESFKLSGLVLLDEAVVKAMDSNFTDKSAVIPISFLKSGEFGTNASLIDSEAFNKLRMTVEEKIVFFANEIMSGNIAVYPFKKGSATACDYCIFGGICGIEADDRPDKFNLY